MSNGEDEVKGANDSRNNEVQPNELFSDSTDVDEKTNSKIVADEFSGFGEIGVESISGFTDHSKDQK